MTRIEYMSKLTEKLSAFDDDFAKEIIDDYNKHFDEAKADGRSEQSVCDELGDIDTFVNDIPSYLRKSSEGKPFADFAKDYSEKNDEEKSSKTDEFNFDWDKAADKAQEFFGDFGKLFAEITNDLGKVVADGAKQAKKCYDEFVVEQEKQNEASDMPTVIFNKSGIDRFKLETIDSGIEITQGDTDEIKVELSRPLTKKEAMMYDVVVKEADGEVKISIILNPAKFGFNLFAKNEPLTFYVTLPNKMDKVKLNTTGGAVKLNTPVRTKKLKIATVSGAVSLGECVDANSINVTTVSGAVTGNTYCSKFNAETVSGAVEVTFAKECSAYVKTISGSITTKLLKDMGAKVTSSALGGSLKVITNKEIIWDNKDNEVFLGLSMGERTAKFGDGGLELKTESVSGNVKVLDIELM